MDYNCECGWHSYHDMILWLQRIALSYEITVQEDFAKFIDALERSECLDSYVCEGLREIDTLHKKLQEKNETVGSDLVRFDESIMKIKRLVESVLVLDDDEVDN